jgi:hypothetical protein
LDRRVLELMLSRIGLGRLRWVFGSANLTNRSMGIDSELHVSWEAGGVARDDRRLVRAIRRVRVSLLAEHGGSRAFASCVRSRAPRGWSSASIA